MTLRSLALPCFTTVLLAACVAKEPEPLGNVEDSGDDQGESESSGTQGDTDSGESATSVGETGSDTGNDTGIPTCDPGRDYYEPASCPASVAPQLPIAGCYEPCAGPGAACSVGECTVVQIEPCPCPPDAESCCGACAADEWLCLEAVPDATCAEIVGTTFQSVDELECGLDPMGPVLCHWTLEFGSDGSFLWMYSDIGEGGTYSCVGGMVVLEGNETPDHSYDLETHILNWNGVDYEPVP
ncbi:MAG: hypothetical protein H6712_03745 [Myxococcales bacterium]|nr:hypothetical protein [Myxococcales bacterium]MCB9712939.1 hypothetical protein [Myxococcales bacterium]